MGPIQPFFTAALVPKHPKILFHPRFPPQRFPQNPITFNYAYYPTPPTHRSCNTFFHPRTNLSLPSPSHGILAKCPIYTQLQCTFPPTSALTIQVLAKKTPGLAEKSAKDVPPPPQFIKIRMRKEGKRAASESSLSNSFSLTPLPLSSRKFSPEYGGWRAGLSERRSVERVLSWGRGRISPARLNHQTPHQRPELKTLCVCACMCVWG